MSQVEEDLACIQDVLREAKKTPSAPRSLFFIWAAIYFVGFALNDFRLDYVGVFRTIAGPGAGP